MTKQNPSTLKVRILPGENSGNPGYSPRGIVTGPGTYAKEGEIAEFPTWTARHLIAAERAELVIKGAK